ncbi:MAG: hypothetical protein R3F59_25390 [Myxococcota bacterium]
MGLPRNDVDYVVVVVDGDGEHESELQTSSVSPPVDSVFSFQQTVWSPDKACDSGGYVLLSYITADRSGVGIVDRTGRWMYSIDRPEEVQIARVRPGRDGKSLVFNINDAHHGDDVATIERVDLLGNPVSSTRTVQGHHDFVETSEGQFAWLGYDLRDVEAPPNTPPDDNPEITGTVCMAADTVVTGPEGAQEGDETVIWNTWEDYPPGVDQIPSDSIVCNRDGCKPGFLTNGCYEFGHANSLAHLNSEGAFYFNFRWLDATMKATDAGDLEWVWGGEASDFVMDPATAFEGMHYSDVRPGKLLAFDNRNRAVGSRLVEYTFDDTSYEQVWQYEEPDGDYENLLGDVQRIPIEGCDNVLVSWSGQAKLQELTRDGEVVWEVVASGSVGQVTSRVTYLPGLYDLSGLGYPD